MNCPACSNPMVRAKATDYGDTYDYCRICKKELNELLPPIKLEEVDPYRFWKITEVSPWAVPVCLLEQSTVEDHQASSQELRCTCGVIYRDDFTGAWKRREARKS